MDIEVLEELLQRDWLSPQGAMLLAGISYAWLRLLGERGQITTLDTPLGRLYNWADVDRVRADRAQRAQVLETVELFRAKVIDVAPDTLTIEATGNPDKLDALLRDLEPYGIKEMVQSGLVAIGRGSRSITTGPALRAA